MLTASVRPANWRLQQIVAQLPHVWRIFVASHSMALVLVNSRRGGFGPYQYLLICPNSLATPVAPSGVSERKPKGLDGGAPPNLSSPGTPSRASVSVRFLPDEFVAQCAANHPGKVVECLKRSGTARRRPRKAPSSVCSPRTIGGNKSFHSRSSFETIAGGTLAREKSSTRLSRDGAQLTMSNDEAR